MKVRVEQLALEGTDRRLTLEPGLNVVTGPIATGKSTLVRLLRFLLGASLRNLPPEAKSAVVAVSGSVRIGEHPYSIVRPVVTTPGSKVEIASDHGSWRLPAVNGGSTDTYLGWLLERLDLPRLRVPSAPTRPDSEPTPVSVNDFWLYTYLAQEELGFSVFGHTDPFKNIKRKYVFDIVYGFYDVQTAQLQERLRSVSGQLRELQAQAALFATFFEDTALANRAELDRELQAVLLDLDSVERETVSLAAIPGKSTRTAELQATVLREEGVVERLKGLMSAERSSLRNLQSMMAQLESQTARITRSIVAGKYLSDLEFVVCPRCGSDVSAERGDEDVCYLCLQAPSLQFSRDTLIKEQGIVEAQLTESQDLLKERDRRLSHLKNELREHEKVLSHARTELDLETRAYVSDRADTIAATASRRSRLQARKDQLNEYLAVLAKRDSSQRLLAELTVEKERLEGQLTGASSESTDATARLEKLNEAFNEILERFQPPEFGEEERSTLDPKTYLPIYYGRRFDNLSSPGLATLVNLAHALAHQITAIELELSLPNILIIDGLSEHLGQEGLDPERLLSVYRYLIELSTSLGDRLQVIVVDNEVPRDARSYVRLELSETSRLIT